MEVEGEADRVFRVEMVLRPNGIYVTLRRGTTANILCSLGRKRQEEVTETEERSPLRGKELVADWRRDKEAAAQR